MPDRPTPGTVGRGQKRANKGNRALERRLAAAKADNPGQAAIDFFPKYLRHVRGEWAGKPFHLAPWEMDATRKLFGTLRPDGLRQYRRAVMMIPRKQGKSTYAAGLALYLLLADNEPGAEIYNCAIDRGQARIVHDLCKAMVSRSKLEPLVKVYRDAIVNPRTDSVLAPLSADAATHLGKNSHGLIFDEFCYLRKRDFWDTMHTSMGARREPLSIAISTAGIFDPEGFGWNQYEYARKVLAGEIVDDASKELLPVLYGLDIDADWTDPENWKKANPMLDVTVPMSFYVREFKRAEESVTEQNAIRRLYLNQWVHQDVRWLDMRAWAECSGEADPPAGARCWGGLDLGSTVDLTAFVLVFPSEDGESYDILPHFYMPEKSAQRRERTDNVPYRAWAEAGLVTLTPGNQTDYAFVRKDMADLADRYDLEEVAFDRWGSTKLVHDLEEDGHTVVEFGQGYASMSGPTKELERLVLAGKLRHGGHELLRWNAGNCVAQSDPHENVKLVKDKSTGRIDGMIALVMALARAGAAVDTTSVYETRGLRSLA